MSKEQTLRERLAALEHRQWMEWSQHLAAEEDLSDDRLKRWESLWIPYAELSEEMKDHDREWADKVLDEVRALLDRLKEERKEKCGVLTAEDDSILLGQFEDKLRKANREFAEKDGDNE
ncbi:hypothetical protein [Natronobacterium haloterrestre]|nr:hypothetical protein [Halobiforma haloterrestris]